MSSSTHSWKECVDNDMKVLGMGGIQGCVKGLHMGKRLTLA